MVPSLKFQDINAEPIDELRTQFFADIRQHFPRAKYTTTAALAWVIIIDAALLNDRLIQDMQKVAREKGCCELQAIPDWPQFYLPEPGPMETELFNAYVRCRWPIHVFALDPVSDEQNVADAFSMRREMQLAAAAALASGEINANAAFRFVRRLETDIETIQLNRKTVAFAHANDTFGWRFYPRVQTPPTVNNFQAFQQTLLGGPTSDWMIDQRQLEPGMRELTVVVLMPSFVPQLEFESRANWFKITNPKHKEMTLHDTMRISRTWQALRMAAPQVCNGGCYRSEDVAWLTKAVDQIERRLPLQSVLVPIPYENTLGGFEMFNSGITDLAPSLAGWYGAPGITTVADPKVGCPCDDKGAALDCPKEGGLPWAGVQFVAPAGATALGQCSQTCLGTTLFIVGDNFSVHDTRVIAGGRCVPYVLMSRQIMRVTIPPNVHLLTERLADKRTRKVVDMHVATPYGVSNHLLIPTTAPPTKKAEKGFFWGSKSSTFSATLKELFSADKPHFELTFAKNGPTKPTIENKSGNPTPVEGSLQVIVVAKWSDGSETLGETAPLPVTQSGGKLTVGAKDKTTLASQIKELVEKKLDRTKKPTSFEVTGYLRLNGWPPTKLANVMVIKLTRLCCGTPTPAARETGFFWANGSGKFAASLKKSPSEKTPHYELVFSQRSPVTPVIANRTGMPTPEEGWLQTVVVAKSNDGSESLGETAPLPVTRVDGELHVGTRNYANLATQIQTLVAEELELKHKPTQLVVTGFLRFNGWPPEQVAAPMIIKLTVPDDGKPSAPAKTPDLVPTPSPDTSNTPSADDGANDELEMRLLPSTHTPRQLVFPGGADEVQPIRFDRVQAPAVHARMPWQLLTPRRLPPVETAGRSTAVMR